MRCTSLLATSFVLGVIMIASTTEANDNLQTRTLATDPVINLHQTIDEAKVNAGAGNMMVNLVVWARGVQTYQISSGRPNAVGPLADLYLVDLENDGAAVMLEEKVGTHYQHLQTPAWEFEDGRVIAEKADVIPGADDRDVSWLNVDLQPNDLTFRKVLRIETRAGLMPVNTDLVENTRHGVSYETLYVFLK